MENHIQQYLNYLENVRQVSDNTVRAFRYSWKYFAESGGSELSELGDVENWIADMNARGNSPSTVKARVSSVKGYFDYLILSGVREGTNPFTGIKTPKRQKYRPDVLTDKERHKVLSKADTDDDKAMVGLMFWMGLRISEVCKLRPRDIDGNMVAVIESKGGYSRRVPINMPQEARAALNRLAGQDIPYLFKSQRSDQITPNGAYRRIAALLEEAGADTTKTHSGRHTAASQYVKDGKSPVAITKSFGWHSPALLNKYTELDDDDLLDALT